MKLLIAFALFAFTTNALAGGFSYKETTKVENKMPSMPGIPKAPGAKTDSTTHYYYTDTKLAVHDDGKLSMITDTKSKTMTQLDSERKVYHTTTLKEMMAASKKMMKKQQAEMSGKEAEAIKRQMKSQKTKVTRKKTGKSKKVAGQTCDIYKESMNMNMGQMATTSTSSVCYMRKVPSTLSKYQKNMIAFYTGYAGLLKESGFFASEFMGMNMKDYEKLHEEKGDKSPTGIALYDKTVTKQKYAQMAGVPKAQMAQMQAMMDKMATTTVTTVSEISEKTPPASAFQIPKGYKKVSFANFMK